MNAFKVIVSTFLACFTLLMINDYFPNTLMSFHIPKWLIISLMVIIFLTSNFFVKEEDNERHTLNWLIISTGYIVLLMLVLPVFGGNSSTGISFSNPIISILLVIVLFDIFAKRRKLKVNRYSNWHFESKNMRFTKHSHNLFHRGLNCWKSTVQALYR